MFGSICKMIVGILAFLTSQTIFAVGSLENPQSGSTQTGIGLVSGWHCSATLITVRIDGAPPVPLANGTPRGDTATTCGKTNTGFGLLVNFNLMGLGNHVMTAFADGVLFQTAPFKVVTLGQEFLQGASATGQVFGFPDSSKQVTLQWQESKQNFSITGVGPIATAGSLNGSYRLVRTTVDFAGGQLIDTAAGNLNATGTMTIAGNNISQDFTVTINGQTQRVTLSGTFTDLGAYILVAQGAQTPRLALISRSPLLITEVAAKGTSLPYSEIDQWALVSQSVSASVEKLQTGESEWIAPIGSGLASLLGENAHGAR